jgi:ribosomal silencing factor RsfS
MERICIYPKDIQIITGKSERQARNILDKIKKTLDKQKHQSITIDEFCVYQGLNCIEVKKQIK